MDMDHGAVGDPPDDDVFGPVEDGEEVFEWVDDQDGPDQPGDRADRPPAPTLAERLAALRAGGRRLRRSRRKLAGAAASIVLACAVGGGCTAWFDGVAGAADRADTVSLAVDSVVDGDPAAATYDASDTSATGQYVIEFANNSPDAVTLASVGVDAGTLMTSTGWKPVGGSARIKGGGTGRVALTVKLSCPLMMMGVQTGALGVAGGADGGGGSMPFPSVDVQVRDADGDQRGLLLPTRVTVSSRLTSSGQSAFLGSRAEAIPQIVTADAGACSKWTADRTNQRMSAVGNATSFRAGVSFQYDKVLTPAAGNSFTLGFTVKNTTDHPETVTAHDDPVFADETQMHATWLPTPLQLGPGQSAAARLTLHLQSCTAALSGAPVLGLTMLEVYDPAHGSTQPVFIDQALSGSLRLASDLAQQSKAACA
jgi:hypothetical protein